MHLRHLVKTKKEYKNLKKQEIHDIFIKTNYTKLPFSMTWLIEILRIFLKEQRLIKYYVIKNLILVKIQNNIGTREIFLQWSIIFLIKGLLNEELHRQVIRKFEKQKVYASFKDNIWGGDPAAYAK